ncbi:hypothetical protein JOD54_000468 [Actinokineospora baliensis]|nr:hypothetical protein [Actinokineospora baliensis]
MGSPEVRIQLQQAQGQLQNGVRSTLLQLAAGLLVIAGAGATWRQVAVAREGQITERFTRAVEQLGSGNVDVRIGAVYALDRIAKNSPPDRDRVQFILCAFVRNHAAWHVGAPDGPVHPTPTVENRPWLQVTAPDVQAAVHVVALLPSAGKASENPRIYLSRVDLRGLQLSRGGLVDAQLRHVNLARCWLKGIRLDGSDLKGSDLRRSQLERVSLVGASLHLAHLAEADLRDADLRGADLRGADLTGAVLDGAKLDGVRADSATTWPKGSDRGGGDREGGVGGEVEG